MPKAVPVRYLLVNFYCPISTALEVAVLAVQAKVVFGLILVSKCLGQSKAVLVSHAKPIIPLFCAVVTVMVNWLYFQPMAI